MDAVHKTEKHIALHSILKDGLALSISPILGD